MYVNELSVREFRCIASADVEFLHPESLGAERLELPNVNLLTGLNGGGKSTVLKAIVAAALGHNLQDLKFKATGWVRRGGEDDCRMRVGLLAHPIDGLAESLSDGTYRDLRPLHIATRIPRDTEELIADEGAEATRAFAGDSDTGFLVAYGPTRQVSEGIESAKQTAAEHIPDGMNPGAFLDIVASPRLQRVKSLLSERAGLQPLEWWLPECQSTNPERFEEIAQLLGSTIPPVTQFRGEREGEAYLFEHDGVSVPYGALSEGLRSHISWIADLLYHLHTVTPPDMRLDDMPGVVLVDEIDQRLHPRWQLDILSWLSTAFPMLQFIVTSHSPLLAGGLRPSNIALLEPDKDSGGARVRTVADDVFGRSADGVLTSSYFDLASTRADPFRKHLRELVRMTQSGDKDAPLQLMRVLGDPGKMKALEETKKPASKKSKKKSKKKRAAAKRKTRKKAKGRKKAKRPGRSGR